MFRSMSAEEYISQRVEQFQKWYDAKAIQAKSRYLRSRIIAVTGAAIVPVVANAIPDPAITRYATTIISLIVSLTVALEGVYHFGDQWKNYRSTEQLLSREKFLFRAGEGPYEETEPARALPLRVERCEAQIAAENSATLNVIAPAAQQPEPATAKAA